MLDKLQERGNSIILLANDLSQKIEELEKWLSDYHGRVNASFTKDDLTLTLKRKGKTQKLFVNDVEATSTSLRIKMAIPDMIPGLIEAMSDEQQKLVKDLIEAIEKVDKIIN